MTYRSYKGFDREELKPAYRTFEETPSLYFVILDHFKGDTITMDNPVNERYKYNLTPSELIEALKELTNEQRIEVLDEFCNYCGKIDINCLCCWPD